MTNKPALLLTFLCVFDQTIGNDWGTQLGEIIRRNVQNNLRGLDTLGDRINEQVYNGLRPVREMESRFRITGGTDGTTIATFPDRKFLIRDGTIYNCAGTISDADGSCSGTLTKFAFTNKEDYCYTRSVSIINNWYCLGNGGISVTFVNGQTQCTSTDGSPVLSISGDDYNKMCGNKASPVAYKYFTSKPMGDYGPNVKCSGNGPYVCTLTERSGAVLQSNSIFVQS